MFGFIRPVKSELRVREMDRFQCVYCGLCHALRDRYGRLQTFFLSYDMTFLALVLESLHSERSEVCARRCDARPFQKRLVLCEDEALALAADCSVLLTYYKLCDSVSDERGPKQWGASTLRALSGRAYQKARISHPEMDAHIAQCLLDLGNIEHANIPSMDRAADPFARLLAGCVQGRQEDETRVLQEMFYHVGRWVYLIDACQDLKEDMESGGYNPVALRYALSKPDLTLVKDQLEITLARSLAAVHTAFDLLDIQQDRDLIENIICLGLPMVTRQVLDGTYQSNGGRKRHGSL